MKTTSSLYAIGVPILFMLVLVFEPSREIFLLNTADHPYIMGFVKFALLATAGEIISARISKGEWRCPKGIIWKAVVWGAIGFAMALLIPFYSGGVNSAQEAGLLPFQDNAIAAAFFTSVIMNLTFGIVMMASHRISDNFIDNRAEGRRVSLLDTAGQTDWRGFIGFVVFKTIPLFWIPAHTVTFALPPQYRVFLSAFLSIVLGAMLSFSRRAKKRG